jgi:CRP-like cAMP-binding protein
MISSESLRFYPFFGVFDDAELKEIAMISEEVQYEKGHILFRKGEKTTAFYVLVSGHVDLFDTITTEHDPSYYKEYVIGEMDEGSILAVSALVPPHILMANARLTSPCRLIKIDAVEILKLADKDCTFACHLLQQTIRLLAERLYKTRNLLATALLP